MKTQQQTYVSEQALWQQQLQIVAQSENAAVQRLENAAKEELTVAETFLRPRLAHEESQMQQHVEHQRVQYDLAIATMKSQCEAHVQIMRTQQTESA